MPLSNRARVNAKRKFGRYGWQIEGEDMTWLCLDYERKYGRDAGRFPVFSVGQYPPVFTTTEVPTAVMICCDTGVYASPNCACSQYLDYFIRSIPIPLLRMWAWIDSGSGVASCSSFAVAPGSSHFWLAASRTPARHCIDSGFQALQSQQPREN